MTSRSLAQPRPLSGQQDDSHVAARKVRLRDGRYIAYSEFGAPRGLPMFFVHDAGSSRLEAAFFDSEARRAGFRIISLDRPGIGESDSLSVCTRESAVDDLLQVADALRCTQFSLLAAGAGSAIAMLVAAREPARINVILGLSVVLPLLESRSRNPGRFARLLVSGFLQCAISLRLLLRNARPEHYMSRFSESLSYSDRCLLENSRIRNQLVVVAQEAVRKGASGVARDTSIAFCPLYVPVERLSMPVHLWQASAETRRRQEAVFDFVESLPAGHLHRLNNRGRYFFWRHTEEIFVVAKEVMRNRNSQGLRMQKQPMEMMESTETVSVIALAG